MSLLAQGVLEVIADILRSMPVPLQFEKFYMPDALRILDAMIEILDF